MLGLGVRGVGWREIEIVRLPTGQPTVRLHGRASAAPSSWAWAAIAVSISHEGDYAVAIAFGIRTQGGAFVFPPDIEARLDEPRAPAPGAHGAPARAWSKRCVAEAATPSSSTRDVLQRPCCRGAIPRATRATFGTVVCVCRLARIRRARRSVRSFGRARPVPGWWRSLCRTGSAGRRRPGARSWSPCACPASRLSRISIPSWPLASAR